MAVGAAGFVICCVLEDLRRPATPNLSLAFGAFSALALMGLMVLETTRRVHFPRFLTFLGDASYSVYLVHYTALSAAAKIIYPVWLRHPVPIAIPFAAMALTALGFGIGVHLLVEKPLFRLLPKTLGGGSNGIGLTVTRP